MTIAESHFERFCALHQLPYARIPEGWQPTPDYSVTLGGLELIVEVKQIDKDEWFSDSRRSRKIGDHIRAMINRARDQVRSAAERGVPAIVLVFNNLDPHQMFGTEQHDFIAAMYGDPTVSVSVGTGKIIDSFEGRNKSFRPGKNDSFSAVGLLKIRDSEPTIHLYENLFAKVPLDYARLPACVTFSRFESERDGAT